MSRNVLTILVGLVLSWGATAGAEEVFYQIPLDKLQITEGTLPAAESEGHWSRKATVMEVSAVLDGPGEAYVGFRPQDWRPWQRDPAVVDDHTVVIRAPKSDQAISGTLYFPKADWSGRVEVKFRVPADAARPESRRAFYRVKEAYYTRLAGRDIPGGFWFRHQAREARRAQGEKDDATGQAAVPSSTADLDWDRTFDLFSGGRAISENLQLDRQLLASQAKGEDVALDSIAGIRVREIDWAPRIKDLHPALDPLAAQIPADQHVVFFPTFKAAVEVSDELGFYSVPLLQLTDVRAEDARTEERYQRQLGLPISTLARLLGPHVARSVALTGSDTYFPTGTDVAVLFEAPQPAVLESLLLARIGLAAAKEKEVQPVSGTAGGLHYRGFRTPDRRMSSYVARLDGAVVVTNSLYQLERLGSVAEKKSPSIASLPEYTFFRNRYVLGAPEEQALVFLSDATIRRWCGPRWRILNSRRMRDAAVLAELQARHVEALVKQTVAPGPIWTEFVLSTGGELRLTESGVVSSTLNSLEFLTPIAELPIDTVTAAEAEAYGRWRQGYEWNWNWAFDPIALRLSLDKGHFDADLTVMPLIAHSDYRELIATVGKATFAPDAGDLHGAPLHFILALDPKAPTFESYGNMVATMAKGVSLSWIGSWLTVYAEADPFWRELATQKDQQQWPFLEDKLGRLPIVVQVDVASGLKLTAFLAGLRAFVEQTAPGMTNWNALTHREQPYVKVEPTDRAQQQIRGRRAGNAEKLALYYSASGDRLIVTLREDLLQQAIDRQIARQETAASSKPGEEQAVQPVDRPAWLGSSAGLQLDRQGIEAITAFSRQSYQDMMQIRAWGSLPILNEWKRLFPQEDPVQVHTRLTGVTLICPGGGQYVWNAAGQTMESTVYGHPGQAQPGPTTLPGGSDLERASFGLSFEDEGLRARLSLQREGKEAAPQ